MDDLNKSGMGNQFNKKHRKYFLHRFIVMVVTTSIIVTIFFILAANLIVKEQLLLVKTDQTRKINSEKDLLEHLLDEAVLDLKIISSSDIFKSFFVHHKDDNLANSQIIDMVKRIFLNKNKYDQLRFIDATGMEIFRIDRINNNPRVYKKDELQDKSNRYYFKESINLKPGNIYISPFDLNVEHGQIEIPHKPMIRICIPVYIEDKSSSGICVLNYNGTKLITELKEKMNSGVGDGFLVNEDGYFLSAPDSAMEWGFMFSHKKNQMVQNTFPEDIEKIVEANEDQFRTKRGLFTVSKVSPFEKLGDSIKPILHPDDYSWKLIGYVPQRDLSFSSFVSFQSYIIFYSLILVVAFIFSYFYAENSLKKYQAQQLLVESEHALKIANETKNKFFSILSHDLKNASSSISGYLNFMKEEFDAFTKEEQKKHLNDVSFAANQHNEFLYEMLDWARVQQGKVSFNPVNILVADLFEEQKEMVEIPIKNKNIKIDIAVQKGIKVFGDLDMIKTIIRNLINNAIKFSYRGGKIILKAESKAERTVLSVIDNGVGMPPEVLENIFELTSKNQNKGTENEPGTGFGLKLVAELVEKNNGLIKVDSQPDKGSTFSVLLPSRS